MIHGPRHDFEEIRKESISFSVYSSSKVFVTFDSYPRVTDGPQVFLLRSKTFLSIFGPSRVRNVLYFHI